MHKKLNPRSMKQENKRMILRYLIESGPHSRVEIAKKTGLAQSAIWRIVEELINEGLIEEKGMATGRRRRAVTYGPTRSFVTAIIYNVEVLETLVAVGFLDGTWRIVERFPTPRVFEEFKEKVKESYENILRTHTLNESISKLVFSLPGIVNTEKRLLIHAPNLGWRDVDFQKEFEGLGFDVMVENDSNLSLLAEEFFSQDVKSSSVSFFLYFGEGIGGAISVNGSIVRGKNFAAGEIGHVVLDISSNREVEDFLSISKLIAEVEKKVNLQGEFLEEKFRYLKRLWFSGEERARKIMDNYLRCVAVVLKNVIYFLNPGVIVLGGIVNDLWETFGSFIKKELEKITDREIADVLIRDTIFKEVAPSLVGGNVLVIEEFLKSVG
ncbi:MULTISPECIES: ROK family transcriptional regulator [Thermotoga]|uniref:ROK family transcriptional regulator n=1 Tax=Thermotoga TaxID=2335 RepID=UPI0002D59DA3|nr:MULTISPECIES: ROK family transcriptional regulator [Thermotoga]AJG40772.1 ArsR family transcriptional regulator [Thermotoga sp. RQ7]KFZ22091.1 ROK family protein [Thermotoga neapolitana LA10]HBF10527.1 ROK family transcriptional regulator [Thermotoga neapolitana]